MPAFLELLRVWVEQIIRSLGYVGIGVVLFLETFFPPIPGEFVLPFAGFLVGRGELLLLGVVAAGTCGSLLGTLVIYAVGRRVGDARVRALIRRYGWLLLVSEGDLDAVSRSYARYGGLILCVGRALPFVRTVVALPAGIEGMPLPHFLFFSTVGSLLWVGALVGLGLLLGSRWAELLALLDQYERTTLVILVLLIACFAAMRFWRWRARRSKR